MKNHVANIWYTPRNTVGFFFVVISVVAVVVVVRGQLQFADLNSETVIIQVIFSLTL